MLLKLSKLLESKICCAATKTCTPSALTHPFNFVGITSSQTVAQATAGTPCTYYQSLGILPTWCSLSIKLFGRLDTRAPTSSHQHQKDMLATCEVAWLNPRLCHNCHTSKNHKHWKLDILSPCPSPCMPWLTIKGRSKSEGKN